MAILLGVLKHKSGIFLKEYVKMGYTNCMIKFKRLIAEFLKEQRKAAFLEEQDKKIKEDAIRKVREKGLGTINII